MILGMETVARRSWKIANILLLSGYILACGIAAYFFFRSSLLEWLGIIFSLTIYLLLGGFIMVRIKKDEHKGIGWIIWIVLGWCIFILSTRLIG
jgi:hypothetical protein